jgi:hypothetical protein
MPTVIPIQETLRPTLPAVHGCRDYTDEKRLLERIDRILTVSGVEQLFLRLSLERFEGLSEILCLGRFCCSFPAG